MLLGGCDRSDVSAKVYPVEEVIGLAYGPLEVERGDLYLPQGVAGLPPVVLLIHGGGWVAGDRAADAGFAKILAARGLATFNIDYRLADAAQPNTQWPAQIVDAQLAVRWLRAHAGTLGIDGTRIAATGDSAGAHLAVMLGVVKRTIAGDQAGLWPDESPAVLAVADQFAPADIGTLPAWIRGCYAALFGTQTPTDDVLASISPLRQITKRSAPMLIIQGDTDDVVPPAQSLALQGALQAAGVPVELIRYPGNHGYEGLDGKSIYALQQRIAAWLLGRLVR